MRHFYTILFLFFVLTFKSHTQQFWGTTSQGGPTGAGTIYSWKKGETPKVRYSFPVETDGRNINPSLVELGDGYLYGTTVYGGRWDHGVLFKVRKEGDDYQVLKHFEGIGDTNPAHGLFLSNDGKLVGMLIEPSSVRLANTSLFSINPDGSDYKIMKNLGHVFPQYNVVSKQRDGFIYSVDGINSAIHKLNLMDNTFQRTTLSNSLGFVGGGLIYASDGYIYTLGRTSTTNSQSHVGVIRVSPDGREVKLLDTLATYNSTMEAAPVCDNFIEKNGFVYGHIVYKQTAQTFRVKLKDAIDVEILHTYNSYAQGSLFVLNDDKIYLYKAAEAGTNGATVVYHFDISTKQLKTVFNGGAYAFLEPSFTTRMLITADRSAAIFIQQIRSHYRSGALWEWRPNNFELKHIVSVGNYPMGAYPSNKLVKDDKGNLYGYATYGGRYGNGTIYKIDIEGNFKVVKHLDHSRDLYVKWISDMVYLNNNLYILSAQNQGGSGGSYVYKFSLKDESFKLIYSSHSTQGKQLMLKNGQLFGLLNTENLLSPPNRGQFFSIDTLGNGYRILSMVEDKPEFVAPFHHMADESPTSIIVTGETQIFRYDMQAWNMSVVTSFPKEVGQKLNAPPIATKNNGILGVALEGGQGFGTVYHLNQNGSDLKVLHRFTDKDGTRRSGLVAGLNGDYYGTNYAGGAKGGGYIYRVNPTTSTVEIMSHFDIDVGIAPSSSLILANNGGPISTLQVLNKGVSITNQLNIGSTVVESNSASVVIDLINKSEKEKIEIGDVQITGPDAAYFQIDQNTLSRALNAADHTQFTIFFKPSARRTYNATLEIISSATANPEISIALQAEGIAMSQQITFSMPETVEAAQDYVEFSATSSSGLPVKVESVYPEYARIEGNRIVILKAGKASFIATQEGNDKYNPAVTITKSLEIKRSKPVFTYEIPGSVPLSRREVEFKLQSSSGQSLEISISNPSIARIEGNKIILLKTGEFFIIANHKQTDRYVQVSVYISMSITKNIQKLSLDFKSKAQITEGSIDVNASSSARLPVSLKSGDGAIARIENNKIILLKPGTVKIEAYQGGNEEYEAASLTYLLTISKASQNIYLDFKTPVEITEKEISYTVSASSGLPVVVTSSDESIARIEGSKIMFFKSGSVNINATQLGNETYEAASTVVRRLEIRKLSQTISLDFKTPV
ncbi:MAG: choice-of-anchor tandem repeat GloVer-containing protein, partial [Runella zeae]